METNQDDPDSTNEHTAARVQSREPSEAKTEAASPAVDDAPDQTLEEPGYGHGV
jgi:hypothetical protein